MESDEKNEKDIVLQGQILRLARDKNLGGES